MNILTIVIIHILMTDTATMQEGQLIRDRTKLFQRFILHQNHTRCSDLMPEVYETCRVYDESDEKAIGNACVHQSCMDTSFNKTCLPVSASFMGPGGRSAYHCICQDQKRSQLTTSEYHWSQWTSMSGSRVGIYRDIMDILDGNNLVLATETR